MPWVPEVFTVPAQQHLLERRQRTELVEVPFFDGLLAGDPDALVASFAGEPEVHDPVRGRIKGERAFRAFAAEMRTWLEEHDVSVEDVARVVLADRGFEEVVLHHAGGDLPFALVADHPSSDGRIQELRLYHGAREHAATRPPLLQPDPGLRVPDVVAEHRRGDLSREPCTLVDDGQVCALEYTAGWPPQAGLAVHVRGRDGGLAAVRVYD